MIIVRCEKCGQLIHKAGKCFCCGSTIGFEKIPLSLVAHENVHDEFLRIEHLVRISKFEEAIGLSKLVLEWMPSCSDVFWLRVLAKNKCTSDEELICKGFSAAESADYYNAVLFADKTQKKVYSMVVSKIDALKKTLKKAVGEHEYMEKLGTGIVQQQTELHVGIEKKREKLFKLWSELSAVEHNILAIEKDCELLVHEHEEALEIARTDASSLKEKIYKIEECTAEDLHKYQIQLGELLQQSEQARGSIDSMKKQHPWVAACNELLQKRDSIVDQINSELSSLKSYENRVQSTITEIERIEARHKNALNSIESYHFTDARSLLGEDLFAEAFSEAGIR